MQNNSNNSSYSQTTQNDTISLIDSIKTILKYKKILIIFTSILTILSIIYVLYIAKPIYEVKADIELGYINYYLDNKIIKNYLIDPEVLKLEILNNFDYSKDPKKHFPKLKTSLIKKTNILKIKIQHKTNLLAKKSLDKIYEYILSKEKSLLDAYKNNLNNNLNKLIESKKNYQKELDDLTDKLNNNNLAPEVQQTIVEIISKDKTQIIEMDSKINRYKFLLSPVNLKNSHYIGKIYIQKNPIKPKKILIVIVTFITSLMLSIFLIFIIDFIREVKKQLAI